MRRLRFDVWELILVAAFTGIVVWFAMRPNQFEHDIEGEARRLAAKFGPHSYSDFIEEWVVREFFNDRRGGVFLDVGAGHYRNGSNTYFLESALGWQGIAVDPIREFEADYLTFRPHTRFRPFFAGARSDDVTAFYVLNEHTPVSSSQKSFTERWGSKIEMRTVPTIALNDLLDREGFTRIDFLSMDIELAEPDALRGFDVSRFRPSLVCIEGHIETRDAIFEYFTRNGYVPLGRYLRADFINLYFTPLR